VEGRDEKVEGRKTSRIRRGKGSTSGGDGWEGGGEEDEQD
jgi:hypothetical protein